MTGIYKIQNKENNKVYIGQAKNIESRWRAHIRMLESNTHHSKKLQNDFNEMGGISVLSFSVVELCNEEVLTDKEKQYIQEYDAVKNGYNCVYSVDENGCLIYDKPNPSDTISISYDLFEKIKDQTTFSEMSIYLYFLFVADDNGEAIVSKRDLANYFGVGKLAIKNRIDKLIKMGLVNKDKCGSFNVYKVANGVNRNDNYKDRIDC